MRNIKFRGKPEDGKWIYGNLIQYSWGSSIRESDTLDDVEVYEFTVGQFTGFFDCKGCEIYEGDLLMDVSKPNSEKKLLEVYFNEGLGSMSIKIHSEKYVTECDSPFCQIYKNKYSEYEVVGNIHENKQIFEKLFAFESSSQT